MWSAREDAATSELTISSSMISFVLILFSIDCFRA